MRKAIWIAILVAVAACALPASKAWSQPRELPPGRLAPGPAALERLERLERMSPEERRKILDLLPPQRRRIVEQRLEWYRQLPPDDRQRLLDRYREFRELPLERQEAARRIFRRFSNLPPARRQAVREEFRRLRSMGPGRRALRMSGGAHRGAYTAFERRLLEDLLDLGLPMPQIP